MINNKEETTLKSVVGKLASEFEENKGIMKGVVSSLEKVNNTIQELRVAKQMGTPLSVMETETVKSTIKNSLNSQLVNSTLNVNVENVSIEKDSKAKIHGLIKTANGLISAAGELVESNKSIKPRRPLINLTINADKKSLLIGFTISFICVVSTIWAIAWANKKVNSIKDQAIYWGDRAYQAALLLDKERPGDDYHSAVSHFSEQPDKVKEIVDLMEKKAKYYHEVKSYILSLLREKDSRDIRVIDWEIYQGEGWFLYRYFDEEKEISIHVWPNNKVEETTDKTVTSLATAQKYSKRKIWTVIREAPELNTK